MELHDGRVKRCEVQRNLARLSAGKFKVEVEAFELGVQGFRV